MRVLVVAYGSRGDVQPFVALTARLRREGHEAVLAAPDKFGDLAVAYDVPLAGLDSTLNDFVLTDADVLATQTGHRPSPLLLARTWRRIGAVLADRLPVMLRQVQAAAGPGVDLVVQGYDETPAEHGHHLAEALGVPWVLVTLSPYVVPSSSYPVKWFAGGPELPGPLNRATHVLRAGMRALGGRPVAAWRRELGLRPRRGAANRLRGPDGVPVPVVHLLSPHVVPPAPDWPTSATCAGFVFADATIGGPLPPGPLRDFLDAGPAPVAVGFGSVRGLEPRAAGRLVTAAVARAGVRAVVVRGAGSIEIDDPPPDVLVVDEVPYSRLFARTSAVVHAASVGISSEALRAGVPQVACPPVGEAMTWARTLHRAGVCPEPVRLRELTPDDLAAAIRTATGDAALHRRVAALAAAVRQEDGTGETVRVLERVAGTSVRSAA